MTGPFDPVRAAAPFTILDVSGHQGAIAWATVAASGLVHAVAVKMTEGATGEGSTDAFGVRNVEGALAVGLPVIPYHFVSALSGPMEQTAHFLATIAPYAGKLAATMLDLERGASGKLPPAAYAVTMAELVRAGTGAVPLLYTGSWIAAEDHLADFPELARCPGWVAAYGARAAPPPCAPWGAWGSPTGPIGWQYTGSGRVPGITGDCDLSRFLRMPGFDSAATLDSGAPAVDAAT